MNEKPFALLTQDECPNCEQVKLLLQKPLKGAYSSQIKIVHRETNPTRFNELAEEYGLQTTPAMIRLRDGAFMVMPRLGGLGELKPFLNS